MDAGRRHDILGSETKDFLTAVIVAKIITPFPWAPEAAMQCEESYVDWPVPNTFWPLGLRYGVCPAGMTQIQSGVGEVSSQRMENKRWASKTVGSPYTTLWPQDNESHVSSVKVKYHLFFTGKRHIQSAIL